MRFYDREKEMERLRSFKGPFTVAVVGRRRVGKTRLIMETFPDCTYLFVSEEKSEKSLCTEWVESLDGYVPPFDRVDRLLEYLINERDSPVFIDEVQNLERVNPSIISRLQKLLDSHRNDSKLIFCGSYVSMVNRLFTESRSPLFGRMDMILHLKELDFPTVSVMARDLGFSFEDSVTLYSIFGGMPRYYEILERSGEKEIGNAVRSLFFEDFSPLTYEGSMVLRNEFGSEFRTYFSVMEAVSYGKSTLSEISDYVGMKPQTLSKYLVTLKDDLLLLERRVPVTETSRNSRMGRYFLRNNFYAFWFRFIHRNYTQIEEGHADRVYEKTMSLLSDHTGRIFEEIIRKMLIDEGKWEKVGSWWNRKGDEIDIVALNEKTKEILFGEVKWRNRPIGCDIIDELMEKKDLVRWHDEDRKERFLIVSKSGFTKKCMERMDEEGIMHRNLKDIERMMWM